MDRISQADQRAKRRDGYLYAVVVLSVISPFIGLPGASQLLEEIIHADPLAIALSLAFLLGVFLAPLGSWSRVNRNDLLASAP